MGCGPFDVDPVVLRELSLAEPVRVVGFAEERVSQFTREGLVYNTTEKMPAETQARLSALFQAGEEAVTLDLLPLIMVIAQEGRPEEEMFLTSIRATGFAGPIDCANGAMRLGKCCLLGPGNISCLPA